MEKVLDREIDHELDLNLQSIQTNRQEEAEDVYAMKESLIGFRSSAATDLRQKAKVAAFEPDGKN